MYQYAIRFQKEQKKSATKSEFYREKGNQRYAERKLIPALEYYNKSICFAPQHSEQLAKGYANRSAVYFSIKMYELSLKNIKLARETGYPKNLVPKLDEREVNCLCELKKLETIPKNEFHGQKPKLSYPPHENVPFIVNCLELKVNEKYGRHIVAKSDLKVGDVVAIDTPFCAVISSEYGYMYCANCFRENNLDLIPCQNCHSAMFCSLECLTAANEAFHSIECPIMDVLVRSDSLNEQAYIALRLFILAMKNFESADELIKFVNNLETHEKNVFNVDYNQTKNTDLLASVLKLMPSQGTSMNDIFGRIIATGLITKILLNLTEFGERFQSNKKTRFLINFVFHLSELTGSNTSPITHPPKITPELENPVRFRTEYPSNGIFPFYGLMNHSCAPNIHIIRHGTEYVMICLKPIKAGEQLFHSYG